MTIHKAKASDWKDVKTSGIVYDIKSLAKDIYNVLEETDSEDMSRRDRTQLKNIAAELETVNKRLEYILHGRY